MKEAIYTIPISEVFEPKCGCPICSIRNTLEERCLDYIMGAAMMEPDVRTETNKLGFCHEHLTLMMERNNRLAIALMLESHMELLDDKHVVSRQRTKKDGISPAETCFVCNEINTALEKIIDTIFTLYTNDANFRHLFRKQEFFCFPHYELLCQTASKKLHKKTLEQFTDDLTEITKTYLVELTHDVHAFSAMFDYRNANKEQEENVKDSLDRAILFLTSRK